MATETASRTSRQSPDPFDVFATYLKEHRLRNTAERNAVLKELVQAKDHLDAEGLLVRLRKRSHPVSRATLYRTLDHLVIAGLVKKHSFGQGHAQYEYVLGRKHHDHMVCDRCGLVIEFINDEIESLQEEVCRQHGFQSTNHVMEIFGICKDCRSAKKK
ncbi:MAG: transcriptional repressor [Candidatus Eisenbacteria bacterium]|uniref:Ferric uptake regulation protein n=1 Tax=Eiseniibacteriota bacterium TaxID=2212470 RepID=A0A7Y2E9U9_UNCEI|nr:transcriptional repressor [Candidatus Eisenbacteria bacterium]